MSRGPWRLVLALMAVPLGAAVQLQQAEVAGPVAGAVMVLIAVMALLCSGLVHKFGSSPLAGGHQGARQFSIALATLAVAGLAFSFTDWRAQSRLADALAPTLEGQDIELVGVVVGLPHVGPQGAQFELSVESARLRGQTIQVPQLVRLSWVTGWDGESLLASPPANIVAGDRWQVPARLKRPHGAFNPHGFDLELWMFERGLGASGSVRPGAQRLAVTQQNPIDRLRQRTRDAVLRHVADAQAAGVLVALAVGDQAAIERDDWDLFRKTGVAHALSISGLHITMFAWLAAGAVRRVWRHSARASLALPAPDAARWGGLALAVFYALVSGWGVPAQRTVWMLASVALLQALGRRWPWPLVWLVAGCTVVLIDPWALMQPGFWLSFVAVGVLMASEPASGVPAPAARVGLWKHLRAGFRTQWVASVALAPLSLIFFQQVSVIGLVANVLAIPWITLVVTPLALLGLLWPPLWELGAFSVQVLVRLLAVLASVPWVQWSAAATPAWAAAAGLLGGLLLVLPLPWRLRWLGLPLILPLLVPAGSAPREGEVELLAVDVGQGTSVLVRTRQHLLLYDAGPSYSPQSDAGSRSLLPLLRARGETAIDTLVLSHRDADHIGGAQSLLAGTTVRSSLSSLERGHPLLARLPSHRTCVAGQQWVWDGVQFEVLHPTADDFQRKLKSNALSCVIRVSDRHGPRLLLTGDIEAEQEAELLARTPKSSLRAPVLLLPHHGSRTSSTPALLQAVAPRQAVAQVAYRSRYGHPAPEVEARVAAHGVALLRSDYCGAWSWPSAPASLAGAVLEAGFGASNPGVSDPGTCERQRRRRYWHHPGPAP